MSGSTDELKLYLTDMQTDGEDFFDFDRDLNENWEKIDKFAQKQRLKGIYFQKIKDITITIPAGEKKSVEIDSYPIKELD